ncbi:hypothetical protein PSAB6_110208 [Paraburkholderia sabiae]|nr:hypothetical protein PSAB6_110208 [Paraburkholderia sabiae]
MDRRPVARGRVDCLSDAVARLRRERVRGVVPVRRSAVGATADRHRRDSCRRVHRRAQLTRGPRADAVALELKPWQARAGLLMSSELFRALDITAETAHHRRRVAPWNTCAAINTGSAIEFD